MDQANGVIIDSLILEVLEELEMDHPKRLLKELKRRPRVKAAEEKVLGRLEEAEAKIKWLQEERANLLECIPED